MPEHHGRRSAFSSSLLVASLSLVSCLAVACGGSPKPESEKASAEIPPLLDGPEYAADVDAWHARRVENLRSKTGWLTLIGLFWLQEGDNTFGSAGDNTLAFPEKAPARAGTLRLEAGKVTVTAAPEAPLLHDGEPVDVLELASDAGGEPTILDLGSLRFYVIDREGRLGIRLKDSESATLESFAGIDRFPVEPAWRFEARWEAYDPPQTVFTPNVLGSAFEEECPGALVLTINGEEHRLEPTSAGEGNLFLVFGDATNGDSTYGGGRFLELGPPANGKVLVDFNRAYNPPCVFTPYATCPLPRRENRLPVEIPAGEKMWGEGHHDT